MMAAADGRGNTGYTQRVAKVMISLPDELLARVDARASEQGSTRSATLRELTERALRERERLLARRMAEIDAPAAGRGGNVAEQVKAQRPA
jgi:predicted transcriptional regulator